MDIGAAEPELSCARSVTGAKGPLHQGIRVVPPN